MNTLQLNLLALVIRCLFYLYPNWAGYEDDDFSLAGYTAQGLT